MAVGALVRAIADTLQARFNPVAVLGEISGFSRAASGHCYFSLKDEQGQLRCAMFRRAAQLSGEGLRDGMLVEVRGRLDVYGPRGDLQLIVESARAAGAGGLFERFMRLKAELEAAGYFDTARKRPLPVLPRRIGLVTSLGAAALRDVATALQRRVPHLPVVLFPAPVQGDAAPEALCAALDAAYRWTDPTDTNQAGLDVLLLVRGGGSLEDLWAFNSPLLVKKLVEAPMPVVCGVGHETDFTLADFAADVRAATPTAAAELCAPARDTQIQLLLRQQERLHEATWRLLDERAQRLDRVAQRLGRPSERLAHDQRVLARLGQNLSHAAVLRLDREENRLNALSMALPTGLRRTLQQRQQDVVQAGARLSLLDPGLVLQRGYAWLADVHGHAVTRAGQVSPGQPLRATLVDGSLGVRVEQVQTNGLKG